VYGYVVADFLGFEEGMSKKEFLKGKCHQLLFGWECCGCWYKFAHFIELFIMDAFVDLFITVCIVINTAFMAMEQEGMDHDMKTTLKYGNYVRSAARSLPPRRIISHQLASLCKQVIVPTGETICSAGFRHFDIQHGVSY